MSLTLFLILMLVCCSYAIIRGGAPERASAVLQIAAYLVGGVVRHFDDGTRYAHVAFGSAALDLALLGALIGLASRSTRFWPLWVAGWQLAAIIGHLAKLLDPAMLPAGYAIQAQIWAYPMLLATAAGAWRHQTRLRGGDSDPAWKTFSI